jgi:hypothetical protein
MKIDLIPGWVKLVVPLAMILSVLGGGYWLKSSRDHWKTLANDRQTTITQLQTQIVGMTTAQDVQHQVSTKTVEKVVELPAKVRTVVQRIHDAPIPQDCATPDYPAVRNEI